MPFVAGAHDEGARADDLADPPLVYQFPAGLEAAAEKGVRGGADAEALCRRQFDDPPRLYDAGR